MDCKKVYGPTDGQPAETIVETPTKRFVTDDQITQWTDSVIGKSMYTALVFMRSATVPDTPVGGSFDFPIPDGGLWSTTPLPSIDPLFVSTRLFVSDGGLPQADVWTPPTLFVQHGSQGFVGEKGDKGDTGNTGAPGKDGIDGAAGVNGNDGTSVVWLGEATSHPINPENGQSYRNTVELKTYIYWDAWYQMTVDGQPGVDGVPIVWKGESVFPPANPEINWAYRDSDNGIAYIWDGLAWEVMVQDGSQGADGSDGIPGFRGSQTFTIEESDISTIYVTPTTAAVWATDPFNTASADIESKNVARDIIGVPSGSGISVDGYLRPNDKITIADASNQITGTRVYFGNATNDPTTVDASMFGGLVTEVIDGNMVVKGSVSAEKLGADVISSGTINTTLLTGATIQTDDNYSPNGQIILQGSTNNMRIYDNTGQLRVKLGKLV